MSKPFAIVTGASSGSGLELAAIRAEEGFDLLVAADRPEIQAAAVRFRGVGADVTVVERPSWNKWSCTPRRRSVERMFCWRRSAKPWSGRSVAPAITAAVLAIRSAAVAAGAA